MIEIGRWSTKGLIPDRIPNVDEYGIGYFSGHVSDGLTYPAERQYLNPNSDYRYKYLDVLEVINQHVDDGIVLDAGCGPGHLSNWAAKTNAAFQVASYDISYEVLAWTKNVNNIPSLIAGDINHLPFMNESFSGVIFLDILEHVYPQQARYCVNQAKKLLKPDGYIFIMIPNRNSWDQTSSQIKSHIWLPSVDELVNLLQIEEFQSESIEHYTRGFPESKEYRQETGRDLKLPLNGRSIFIMAKK